MKKKPSTNVQLCKILNQLFLLIHVNRAYFLPKVNNFCASYWAINR